MSLALVFFGVGAAIAIVILKPRKWRGFEHDLRELLGDLKAGTYVDQPGIDVGWAEYYEDSREKNHTKVKWLTRGFTTICALTALQVICWGIAAL